MASPSISLHQSRLSLSSPSVQFPSFASPSRSVSSVRFATRNGGIRRISLIFGSSRRIVSAASSSSTTSTSVKTEIASSEAGDESTAFVIRARNRIGILQVITRVFQVLGLQVDKATVEVEGEGNSFTKTFFVTDSRGNKIEDEKNLERIKSALIDAIDGDHGRPAVDSTSCGEGYFGQKTRRGDWECREESQSGEDV